MLKSCFWGENFSSYCKLASFLINLLFMRLTRNTLPPSDQPALKSAAVAPANELLANSFASCKLQASTATCANATNSLAGIRVSPTRPASSKSADTRSSCRRRQFLREWPADAIGRHRLFPQLASFKSRKATFRAFGKRATTNSGWLCAREGQFWTKYGENFGEIVWKLICFRRKCHCKCCII